MDAFHCQILLRLVAQSLFKEISFQNIPGLAKRQIIIITIILIIIFNIWENSKSWIFSFTELINKLTTENLIVLERPNLGSLSYTK